MPRLNINHEAYKETRKFSHSQEKLTDTVLEQTQKLYLLDKHFKSSILNILKNAEGNQDKQLMKQENDVLTENINKYLEILPSQLQSHILFPLSQKPSE